MNKTKNDMTLLSSNQLSQLLRLGGDHSKALDSDSARELFESYWQEPLSNVIDSADFAGIPENKSLENVLTDSKMDIRVLQQIKSYFKKMLSASSDESEREVAGILYQAAIAAALVFHSKRITSLSWKDLYDTYLLINDKDYLPKDLKQMLVKGIDAVSEYLNN